MSKKAKSTYYDAQREARMARARALGAAERRKAAEARKRNEGFAGENMLKVLYGE